MNARILLLAALVLFLIQVGWSSHVAGALARQAQPRILISAGDRAPEPVRGIFESFKGISLNNRDEVAFRALVGGGTSPGGIFLSSAGALFTVMAVGDPTPLGGSFSDLDPPLGGDFTNETVLLNDAGAVAFSAKVSGGNAPGGIFLAQAGRIRTVVALGEPTPLGGTFQALRLNSINGLGDVAFTATISGGSADEGIFVASSSFIKKIVAVGDETLVGGVFAPGFGSVRLNQMGQLAFSAGVTSRIGQRERDRGIFLISEGMIQKVALGSERSPRGEEFGDVTLLGGPVLNNQGEVAFAAKYQEVTVYLASGGTIKVLFQQGYPTPADRFGGFHLNDNSTVALPGTLPYYPTISPAITVISAQTDALRSILLPISNTGSGTISPRYFFLSNNRETIVYAKTSLGGVSRRQTAQRILIAPINP